MLQNKTRKHKVHVSFSGKTMLKFTNIKLLPDLVKLELIGMVGRFVVLNLMAL